VKTSPPRRASKEALRRGTLVRAEFLFQLIRIDPIKKIFKPDLKKVITVGDG
jgi:hypothetical protein